MPFSLFVLALYVFLQSAPAFSWFTVDPKFTACVGILFVLVVVFDAAFWLRSDHPTWFARRARPNPNQQ